MTSAAVDSTMNPVMVVMIFPSVPGAGMITLKRRNLRYVATKREKLRIVAESGTETPAL
jgi:hypothetical protein